jgi:hypothetical protein
MDLSDKKLLHTEAFIDGEWLPAINGQTCFDVSSRRFPSCITAGLNIADSIKQIPPARK